MSLVCTIFACSNTPRTLCYGCNQQFCPEHMIEHGQLLNSQLSPLFAEMNVIAERLKSIDLDTIMSNSHEQLEKWRADGHKVIDEFFEQKCQELDRHIQKQVEQQYEDVSHLRTKISSLIQEQDSTHADIDLLRSALRTLASKMNIIEKALFKIEVKLLTVDDDFIRIEGSDVKCFALSSIPALHRTINYVRENWAPLACNNQHLLIYQEPNLCLVDCNLSIIKRNLWMRGTIYDMCWSSILKRFIVINNNDICLVDEDSMSIETIHILKKRKWLSCTTSERSLYLSTKVYGSSILEFSLLPNIQLIKQWSSPETCSRDEVINGITYSNGKIAMMIKNVSENTIRIETRSSATLKRLWTIRLNIVYSQNIRTRCCALNNDEWLVVDRNASHLFHISKDGHIKSSCTYDPPPFCALVFNRNVLAISTARGVNLYTL